MCENFPGHHAIDAQPNLKTRKLLFASLLALICIVLVYSVFQRDKPWVVPEEAKKLRNPLRLRNPL